MVHVVLDTNIYRKNPSRDNLNFVALRKLCEANSVKLHIPYIVEREFQTQQREIYDKDIKTALSGLASLTRKALSPDLFEKINELKQGLEAESDKILISAESQLTEWADTVGANRYPLCLGQAQEALEAYFKGLPPLKKIKHREDLPDSFIVQAIKKLCAENGSLYLIAEDKKVCEAFENDPLVTVLRELSDFVESEAIQGQLKELDMLENLSAIEQAIAQYESDTNDIVDYISRQVGEKLIGLCVNDHSIPDDNNEATINGYYDPENIELLHRDTVYYGNGQFGIPFSLKIKVIAFYYIFKSDYYGLENTPSVSDHNDHYFEAEDEFDLVVNGMTSVKVDRDNLNLDEFPECVVQDSTTIDEITDIDLAKRPNAI